MKKELDLHGTKHADAFRKVDHFIGQHIQMGTREVFIVTGHSKGMKDVVNDVLNDYSLDSEEEWGNNGKLIVKMF
jgi:DNA-nicking Smr family endonuclease